MVQLQIHYFQISAMLIYPAIDSKITLIRTMRGMFGFLRTTPSERFSTLRVAEFECPCFLKAFVASFPAYFIIVEAPPGCLSRKEVTSHTFPSMMIQQSSLELCLLTS